MINGIFVSRLYFPLAPDDLYSYITSKIYKSKNFVFGGCVGKSCIFMEQCDFIRGINGVSDAARQDFIDAYCSDERSANLCIRRMYMNQNGKYPAKQSEVFENPQPRFTLA